MRHGKRPIVCGRARVAGLACVLCAVAWAVASPAANAQQEFGARDRASTEAVESLKAYAAYKMGDYATAREGWQSLAERGNPSAMLNLANLYEQGQGVPRDPAVAAEWVRRAADLGDPRAQVEIGMAYEKGLGVARDPETAAAWFRKAAEQGDATAQFNLGVMLATAYGAGLANSTEEQRREAADWLEKAAARGHPDANDFLALLRKDR